MGAPRVRRCAPRLWKPAAPAAHARGASKRRCRCARAASYGPTTPENIKERDLGRVVAGLHAQHRTGHLNRETLRTMVPGSLGWRAACGIRERWRCAGGRLCVHEGCEILVRLLRAGNIVVVLSGHSGTLICIRCIGAWHPIACALDHLHRPHRQESVSDADFGQWRFESAAALTRRAAAPWPWSRPNCRSSSSDSDSSAVARDETMSKSGEVVKPPL